jgi:subtilisin family serine protease
MAERSNIALAPLPAIRDARFAAFFAFGPPDVINAKQARLLGNVTGDGMVVAVLDSGCRASHRAFATSSEDASGRVLPGRNFTGVGGDLDVDDTIGHGTAVSALIAARALAPVVAPGARILPLKVNAGPYHSDLTFVLDALSWLLGDEGSAQGASVVCMALGDDDNYRSLAAVPDDGGRIRQQIADQIAALRARGIPTVTAAGNGYCKDGRTVGVGMCFPAIMPECISVGATFGRSMPETIFPQYGGARIVASSPGQLTPFSQRLPEGADGNHFTRLFGPGAPVHSAGISSDSAETEDIYGTSLAVPLVVGAVALMQEWHKKNRGRLPSCDELQRWLGDGGAGITDKNEGRDNVDHTGATFKLVDAFGAMQAMIGPPLAS